MAKRSSWHVVCVAFSLILCFSRGSAEAAFSCDLIVRLDSAVTFAALQLDLSYPVATVSIDGSGTSVACSSLTTALGTFDDDDAGTVNAGFVDLVGVTGPVDLMTCALTASVIPSPSDFSVTVIDASDPSLMPIVPLPSASVSSVNCSGPTTTTSLPGTTTTLASSTTTTASSTTTTVAGGTGRSCVIGFDLMDPVSLGALQFDVDYSGAGGDFDGSGTSVACSTPLTSASASFNDDEATRTVSAGYLSLSGFTGPTPVADCLFTPVGADPLPTDFPVTVIDASAPDLTPINPPPLVEATSVFCSNGTTTTTSTTTTTVPVCGDGVVQAGEECDDGGANSDTAPDACRTTCVAAACGDGVIDSGEACDDGGANSDTAPDACRTTCVAAACGDGVIDSGEECDNGTGNSDLYAGGCLLSCMIPPACGDADDTGAVTVLDAQRVLFAAVGLISNCPPATCDVNGDTQVNVTDAQITLAEAVGLPVSLSCQTAP